MNFLTDYLGSIFWLQMALGFVGLLVAFERLLFFQHTRVNTADLLLGVANHVKRRAFAEALHEVDRSSGPVSRVVHAILLRHYLERTNLREVAQEAGQLEVPRIERNMRVLLAVALLSPLFGLFGTILGLIEVFMALNEVEGALATSVLAGGLFRALISTAIGLAIAIPAYIVYLYLLSKGDRLLRRLERAGIETVNLICDAREQDRLLAIDQPSPAPHLPDSTKPIAEK